MEAHPEISPPHPTCTAQDNSPPSPPAPKIDTQPPAPISEQRKENPDPRAPKTRETPPYRPWHLLSLHPLEQNVEFQAAYTREVNRTNKGKGTEYYENAARTFLCKLKRRPKCRKLVCHLCLIQWGSEDQLVDHVLNRHYRVKRAFCGYCAFGTYTKTDLETHCRWAHPSPHYIFVHSPEVALQFNMQCRFNSITFSTVLRYMRSEKYHIELVGKLVLISVVKPPSSSTALSAQNCRENEKNLKTNESAGEMPKHWKRHWVTFEPYPDSLPPVPGGCLPCSVQLAGY